jgi:hypothetical protein
MPITIEGDIDPYPMPTTIGEFRAMVDSNHLAAELFAVSGSSTANSFMDCYQDGTRVVDLVGCDWKSKSEEEEGKRNAPYSKLGASYTTRCGGLGIRPNKSQGVSEHDGVVGVHTVHF